MKNLDLNFKPVGKYVNDEGREGVRYVWELDGIPGPYVESGAFYKRTYLGINKQDLDIAAYTTSVSLGCLLSQKESQCRFCVTGNCIPYKRLLTAEEIALQNIFMVLDDSAANEVKKAREFAYMGQGEPGFSYEQVRDAIVITNKAMAELGYGVYRHIFATAGVPAAIKRLTDDFLSGFFGQTNILLHLSIHSVIDRGRLMPINNLFPLEDVIKASEDYAKATGMKVVVNFMMLKNASLMGLDSFNTASVEQARNFVKLLNPEYHRVILCEYNADEKVGSNEEVSPEEVDALSDIFSSNGFEIKKFVAFGKKSKLACGLLGGDANPNLDNKEIKEALDKSIALINKYR
jgi:adenine C2-methylase RlmN of 23S rRNA A2503 and tRNA A37